MEELIKDIEAYCKARKISVTTFGNYAVGDGKFVKRLKGGAWIRPPREEKARQYMRDHPAEEHKNKRPRRRKRRIATTPAAGSAAQKGVSTNE